MTARGKGLVRDAVAASSVEISDVPGSVWKRVRWAGIWLRSGGKCRRRTASKWACEIESS